MANSHTLFLLKECKIRADHLLQELRSAEPMRRIKAARRLRSVPALSRMRPEEIVSGRDDIRRKHALAAVAAEVGYPSWEVFSAADDISAMTPADMFKSGTGGFLNAWFRSHHDARAAQTARGGYIFPCNGSFAVCGRDFVVALGLDPDDPDWERIAYDWACPSDVDAWRRLRSQLRPTA